MQQAQQALAAVQDIIQAMPLLIVDFTRHFIQQQFRKSDNNIQRRAEIMGYFFKPRVVKLRFAAFDANEITGFICHMYYYSNYIANWQ